MKRPLDIGHVYDVTDYYHKNEGTDYARYFVCEDVYDFHIYRIILGYNSQYDKEEDTKLIEQSDINKWDIIEFMEDKANKKFHVADVRDFPVNCAVLTDTYRDTWAKEVLKAVINCDTYDNDDVAEYRYNTPIEDLIDDIDGGYGITTLDENLDDITDKD